MTKFLEVQNPGKKKISKHLFGERCFRQAPWRVENKLSQRKEQTSLFIFVLKKCSNLQKTKSPEKPGRPCFLASFITMESSKISSSTADLYYGRSWFIFWASQSLVCLGGLVVTALGFGLKDGGSIPQGGNDKTVNDWNSQTEFVIESSMLGINPAA